GHVELRLFVVPPPAGEARPPAVVLAVDVQRPHGAGPAVEVLVPAPDTEIDAGLAELMRYHADGVRAIEADQHVTGLRSPTEFHDVEQLPAAVEDARQDGDGRGFVERTNDVGLIDGAPVAA